MSSSAPGRLSRPQSGLVGRAGELERLESLLGRYQLVTVTGPGGSGKTRLAWEVAWRLRERFEHGVWTIELAGVSDPAAVPSAVAAALGVVDQPGISVLRSVTEVSAGRHRLIVLDNCEHVLDAAAGLAQALTGASEDLRVLATSREPLGAPGEARFRLAPLAVPGPGSGRDSIDHADAVRLFVTRALLVDPDFALDDTSAPIVSEIVRRLDGMPLAVELAAARVGGLGVTEIRDRLTDRFRILVGGTRTAPARQRSLQAAVDWSYDLLTAAEQRVFRWLSVFAAPFTLSAVEAVTGADALAAVPALAERSMLVAPRDSGDGRSRYTMLETMRAYGADRLAEHTETIAAHRALAAWAVDQAEQASTQLDGPPDLEASACRWFDTEDDNLRTALTWTLHHDPPAALRLAVAIGPWWNLRGRAVEGRPLTEQAMAACNGTSEIVARAHLSLARLAGGRFDLEAALVHATTAAEIAGAHGCTPVAIDALLVSAGSLRNKLRTDDSADVAREALRLADEVGYLSGTAGAYCEIGFGALYQADALAARRCAIKAHEGGGDVNGSTTRNRVALLAASSYYLGDYVDADVAANKGLCLARKVGSSFDEIWFLGELAAVELAQGRVAEAAEHERQALAIAARVGDRLKIWEGLKYAGFILAAADHPEDAACLFAGAHRTKAAVGISDPPMEEVDRDRLKQHELSLTPNIRQTAARRAAVLSTDQLVDLAVSLLAAVRDPPEPAAPLVAILSPRERELVALIARGQTDRQISENLYISLRTVRSHLDRIRDKTGCRRRADLTRLAAEAGLLPA